MIYLFVINLFLIGLLFYKEYQHKQEIKDLTRDILSARLSKDAYEFKKEEKVEEFTPPTLEIPLEDVDVDDILKINKEEKE